MKWKKVLSVAVAACVTEASMFTGFTGQITANAAVVEEVTGQDAAMPEPVYENDFESDDLADAVALSKGLANYTGEAAYADEGITGRAIVLGNYGLGLNKKNIGRQFTVSMWLKVKDNLLTNSPVIFLGNCAPENWLCIAGNNNGDQAKTWTRMEQHNLMHTTLDTFTIPRQEWMMLTVVSDGETLSIYENDNLVSRVENAAAAGVLGGADRDIYIGVNLWDSLFAGLVDNLRVYDSVLSADEITSVFMSDAGSSQTIKKMLNNNVEKIAQNDILGENPSLEEVAYDLKLPAAAGSYPVIWSSSDDTVISPNGKVYNQAEDREVILTAVATNGAATSDPKEIYVKVKALDRTPLETVMKSAEEIEQKYLTRKSAESLNLVLESVKRANTQTEIKGAANRLQKALDSLEYKKGYSSLWAQIEKEAPEKRIILKKKDSKKLFALSQESADVVKVTYESKNPAIAIYNNGSVKALKAGRTMVTATVTSYDGWTMKYSTLVTVVGNIQGKASVKKGKSIKLSVAGNPGGVKWSVDKKSRASINSKGKLKAKKAGKVTVKAKIAGITLSKKITIKK